MECLGGFRALEPDSRAEYRSSLAPNGLVSWSSQQLDTHAVDPAVAEVVLTIDFPEVDWRFLQSVYGWAALQYQAWARGYLEISADLPQTITFYTDNVIEFWLDNKLYFGGDFYAYRRAPLVLHLAAGKHKADIRLVRDVRAMGGIGVPNVLIKMKAEISNGTLAMVEQKLLVSDIVDGILASPFASIPVRNEARGWVDILEIESLNVRSRAIHSFKPPLMFSGGDMCCWHARKGIAETSTRPVEAVPISPICARPFNQVTVLKSHICYK